MFVEYDYNFEQIWCSVNLEKKCCVVILFRFEQIMYKKLFTICNQENNKIQPSKQLIKYNQ